MRVTENTYQGPGASMMKPGMNSRELNDIHRSVRGPTPEDNIRQLRAMPPPNPGPQPGPAPAASPAPPPFLKVANRTGGLTTWDKVPNPAYGQAYGLEWNGREWVQKDPNADLARQAMEMELEARRQEMELQRQKFSQESGVTPDLKAWLANRLGSGR
jgi:hypothetical protein